MQKDEQGLTNLEKLQRKVTHDIEQQLQDLLKLRDFVAKKTGATISEIRVPKLQESV